jgi:nitroreductase
MSVSQAIAYKRAVRQFKEIPLPKEVINSILNAGRRSQSSKNTQPWGFIAIQDKEKLQALSELGTYAGHLAGASLGVAIVTEPPDKKLSILFDAGQSAAYMQLAGWELGVASCIATIHEPDAARKLLGFPSNLFLHISISFGYPLDQDVMSAPPVKGGRKPFGEVVHWEEW